MTAAQRLATIGEALYGARWQSPLADDLGVSRETIRRWMSGHTALAEDHGIFRELQEIIQARIAILSGTLNAFPFLWPRPKA